LGARAKKVLAFVLTPIAFLVFFALVATGCLVPSLISASIPWLGAVVGEGLRSDYGLIWALLLGGFVAIAIGVWRKLTKTPPPPSSGRVETALTATKLAEKERQALMSKSIYEDVAKALRDAIHMETLLKGLLSDYQEKIPKLKSTLMSIEREIESQARTGSP
jgi:hypothetical protein